jgi:hypothetical protein
MLSEALPQISHNLNNIKALAISLRVPPNEFTDLVISRSKSWM